MVNFFYFFAFVGGPGKSQDHFQTFSQSWYFFSEYARYMQYVDHCFLKFNEVWQDCANFLLRHQTILTYRHELTFIICTFLKNCFCLSFNFENKAFFAIRQIFSIQYEFLMNGYYILLHFLKIKGYFFKIQFHLGPTISLKQPGS